ncbi:MAG: methyltransferase domain-containing protein [Deferribacterales bacterium]
MNHLTKEEQQKFWNSKAAVFPRFEEGENNYEAKMLNNIRNLGVDFKDRTLLDVGCGSGMYTIRLAREAQKVTASDISETMLDILMMDAESLGISNIIPVLSDWKDFHSDERFDIVFCSMTPAAHSDSARQKLTDYSRGQIIYMGFGGVMESDVLNALYPVFGISQREFNDAARMKEWLTKNGYAFRSKTVDGEWLTMRTEDELVHNSHAMLSTYRIDPDRETIRKHIGVFSDGKGKFTDKVKYRIEVIVWENQN